MYVFVRAATGDLPANATGPMRQRDHNTLLQLTYRIVGIPGNARAMMFVYLTRSSSVTGVSWLSFQPSNVTDLYPRARLTAYPPHWKELSEADLLMLYERATPTLEHARRIGGLANAGDRDILDEERMSTRRLLEQFIEENDRLRDELKTLLSDLDIMNEENQRLTARLERQWRRAGGAGRKVAATPSPGR